MKGSFTTTNVLLRIPLVVVCVTIMAHGTVKANLLTNGSFESGPSTNGFGVYKIPVGATNITGWVVTRSDIDLQGPEFWYVTDGIFALDLNGAHGPGGIKQTFATVSGQVYSVTFSLAGNPSTQALMTMGVQAAGQSASFSFDTTGHDRLSNMGWVTKTWDFSATNSQTALEFYSTFTGSLVEGPAVDNVSVVAVPEPSPAMLVLGVLAALGLVRKGRDGG